MQHKFTRHVQHLTIALRIAGFAIDEPGALLIDELHQLITQKKGRANLRDIAAITSLWKETYLQQPQQPTAGSADQQPNSSKS